MEEVVVKGEERRKEVGNEKREEVEEIDGRVRVHV